ncbi:MAG: phosphatase PAP2 family protein [Spirochaetes bacterium]|nr:phosphatase PAP2 family protein [Spirochaetota bacterium]MBU1081203.1 phosphatase PAP2 family protein [Spirochaetota bacterium]
MKKHVLPAALAVVAIVGLMAAFTAFDLPLATALQGRARGFARLFEIIGQIPFALILFAAPMILLFTSRARNAVARIMLGAVWAALSGLGAFFAVMQTVFNISGEDLASVARYLPLEIALTVLMMAGLALILRRAGRERLEGARRFAVVGLLLIILDMVTVEVLKNVFGRTRPRELAEAGNSFGRWFEIHGKTGRKSFPSGHSAYSFAAIAWSLLWKAKSVGRRNALAAGLLFGALTALSRVLIGAHFPTDVTMGGVITVSYALILSALFRDTRLQE